MRKDTAWFPFFYCSHPLWGIKSQSSCIVIELWVNSRTHNPENEGGNVPSNCGVAITLLSQYENNYGTNEILQRWAISSA